MKSNLKTLDEVIGSEIGELGSIERKEFDEGFETFKLGQKLKEARIARGLTQEKLAQKCGIDRHYISKIENDVKEIKISTLQKIIELGLDAKLQIIII